MKGKATFAGVGIALLALIVTLGLGIKTARGFPSQQSDCSYCHGTNGSYPNPVAATASSGTVAPGVSYQVSITMSTPVNGATGTGYWIANSNASGATGSSTGIYAGGPGSGATGRWTATMTAPSAPGTYYYKVFGQSGPVGPNGYPGFALYSIIVAAASTSTPTATQVPPTSTATQVPPTSTATQVPPTSTATQVPPTSTATQVPPTSTATQVPPTSTATPPTSVSRGEALYNQYCASCHEQSSRGFVHETIYGASREDIEEAIDEEAAMAWLRGVLTSQDIDDIAVYLGTFDDADEDDEHEHEHEHEHEYEHRD